MRQKQAVGLSLFPLLHETADPCAANQKPLLALSRFYLVTSKRTSLILIRFGF